VQLILQDLEVSYGKKRILHQVSMSVAKQDAVALVGQNGAGKTTLLKSILGVLNAERGRIEFEGVDITHELPHRNVERGIIFCPQGGQVFRNLSVLENLEVSGHKGGDNASIKRNIETVLDLFPALQTRIHLRGGFLSGGERQMLSLAMSLMLSPKLFLIDEPSGGLSPLYVDKVFSAIKKINQQFQTTILLVEQNLKYALEICKTIYVLRNGRMAFHGDKSEIQHISSEFLGF
jgi:branched-chain amino acid transport system ATP-binding protein